MLPLSAHAEHAYNRSRVRVNVTLRLAANGPLTVAQLARLTGHELEHVLGALVGHGGAYAFEDSLVALGIVRTVRGSGRRTLCELTEEGRDAAERLARREHERFASWV
jgi:predicted transcriptional regulator with HTH domain